MNDLLISISEEIRKEIDRIFRENKFLEIVKILLRNAENLSQQNLSMQLVLVAIVRRRDTQRTPVAYRPIAVFSTGQGIAPPKGMENFNDSSDKEEILARLQSQENVSHDTISFSTFPQSAGKSVGVCPSCGGSGLRALEK
jgi:hypothetical protein